MLGWKNLMKNRLTLSPLRHTWILDFDGTLVIHNGYKTGDDTWLPGALDFLKSIPEDDLVIILTAREKTAREKTEKFLEEWNVKYDKIIFEVPMGERVLINDTKPSGLKCAYSVNPARNEGPNLEIFIDRNL